MTNKNDIFNDGEIIEDSDRDNISDNTSLNDVFTYKNLCLEYCFETHESAFYLQRSDKLYELLYNSSVDENGNESSYFYSKDDVFLLQNYDSKNNFIGNLSYISKSNFLYAINKFEKLYKKNLKNIFLNALLDIRLISTAKCLIKNNERFSCYENERDYFQDYRTLYVKYKSAETLIPVSNILTSLISNLNNYMSKGNIDMAEITRRVSELQNFKKYCPTTVSLMSSFMENPESTDLKLLCSKLGTNLQNTENLLELYLKDELSLDNESIYKKDEKMSDSKANFQSNSKSLDNDSNTYEEEEL